MQDLNPHLSGFKAQADPSCPVRWQKPGAVPLLPGLPASGISAPSPTLSSVRFLRGQNPTPQPRREPASPSIERRPLIPGHWTSPSVAHASRNLSLGWTGKRRLPWRQHIGY